MFLPAQGGAQRGAQRRLQGPRPTADVGTSCPPHPATAAGQMGRRLVLQSICCVSEIIDRVNPTPSLMSGTLKSEPHKQRLPRPRPTLINNSSLHPSLLSTVHPPMALFHSQCSPCKLIFELQCWCFMEMLLVECMDVYDNCIRLAMSRMLTGAAPPYNMINSLL